MQSHFDRSLISIYHKRQWSTKGPLRRMTFTGGGAPTSSSDSQTKGLGTADPKFFYDNQRCEWIRMLMDNTETALIQSGNVVQLTKSIFGRRLRRGLSVSSKHRVGPKGSEMRLRLINLDRQLVQDSLLMVNGGHQSQSAAQPHSRSVRKCPGVTQNHRLMKRHSHEVEGRRTSGDARKAAPMASSFWFWLP